MSQTTVTFFLFFSILDFLLLLLECIWIIGGVCTGGGVYKEWTVFGDFQLDILLTNLLTVVMNLHKKKRDCPNSWGMAEWIVLLR